MARIVKKRQLRTGNRTRAYLGVQALAPVDFTLHNRAPTTSDNKGYNIGDEWINVETRDVYKLVSLENYLAIWVLLTGAGGNLTNLIDDAGTVVLPGADHAITIQGGTNIYTTSAANTIVVHLDDRLTTDGQVLIAATGGNAEWRTLTAGAGIAITNAANSITIDSAGGAANIVITGNVNTATSIAGAVNVVGGDNINTAGDGAQALRVHLDQSILQPNTNADGTQGLYSLGGTDFISNYNTNVFFGGSGNRTLTGTNNTGVGSLVLSSLTTGSYNTAIGDNVLPLVTTGSYNIGVGFDTGTAITTEDSNIYLNNAGTVGDSHTLRIGGGHVNKNLDAVYVDGIYQANHSSTYGIGVVDNTDKVATISLDDLKFYIKVGYITKIAAGYSHALALTSDGSVYGVGRNDYGQLGTGDTTARHVWTRVGGEGVTDIAAGAYHSIIVKSGVGYGFGLNNEGQLGDNTLVNKHIPTAMSAPGTAGITDVSCGYRHTAVLIAAAMYACGRGDEGQLGDNTATDRHILTAAVAPGDAGVTDLACGGYHTVVLKTNTMYACGQGNGGQLGDNTATQRDLLTAAVAPGDAGVTAISAGWYHTAILKTNTAYACGDNTNYQLADNTNTQRDLLTACSAPGDAGVSAIDCGNYHTVIHKSGVGYAAGLNSDGQIADNSTTTRHIFTAMTSEGLSGIDSIGALYGPMTYVVKNGILYSSGDNSYGQLSTGDTTDRDELTRAVV